MKQAVWAVLTLSAAMAACSSEPSGTTGGNNPPDGGTPCVSDPCEPDPTPVTVPEVSPSCTDGKYAEVLSDPNADISSLVSSFSAAKYRDFLVDVLALRYPTGSFLVKNAPTDENDCMNLFVPASDRGTAAKVLSHVEVVVHECGHIYDLGQRSQDKSVYQITTSQKFTCSGASYIGANATFPRSAIRTDSFSAKRPPCPTKGSHGCDGYADVYLDGSPSNSTFESGDQGFNMVLEEAVQYVNSLATQRAFEDQIKSGYKTSARDGILTYLWYVQRYLHMARTEHASQYAFLMGDANWRDAILTMWGRAWLYLEATKGRQALGIDDDKLSELVHDPVLMDEIARVRAASGCQ